MGVRRGMRGKECLQEGKRAPGSCTGPGPAHLLSSPPQGLSEVRLNGSWGDDGTVLCSASGTQKHESPFVHPGHPWGIARPRLLHPAVTHHVLLRTEADSWEIALEKSK